MVELARERIEAMRGDLLLDGQVATCGDDLALVMSHTHGAEAEAVHGFARGVFQATTRLAERLGLYGAGQDILSDAFLGNLRGMGTCAATGRSSRTGCRWTRWSTPPCRRSPPARPAAKPGVVRRP